MLEPIPSESRPIRSVFVHEAARMLGVSRRTVYYRIRDGKLRTIRTRCGSRRVLLDSIEALLRSNQDRQRPPSASGLRGHAESHEG